MIRPVARCWRCHDVGVPARLTFDSYVALLHASGTRLLEEARSAGLDAPVPTCPAWSTRSLLAHVSMVHRFATAHVRSEGTDGVPTQTAILDSVDDIVGYYREGHRALLVALEGAPEDLVAMTFLNDAPTPRVFWARRQAHETTIHLADAVGAALGRPPSADEVGIDAATAVDGIDELVRGFFTRGQSRLFDGTEERVAVVASDVDDAWILHVAERLTVETMRSGDGATAETPDATITGRAAQLYLALWNRGDEVEEFGRTEVLDRWRRAQRVSWS